MSHIAIKKWEEFRRKVQLVKPFIDRTILLTCLQEVCQELKFINDNEVRLAYNEYLDYFETIDLKDYQTIEEPWYSLSEIVEYDIVSSRINSSRHVITKIRDLLWLAYKTDIQCVRCDEDEMRVLATKDQVTIYLCCDRCGFISNLQCETIFETEILYPLSYKKVIELGFHPSKDEKV